MFLVSFRSVSPVIVEIITLCTGDMICDQNLDNPLKAM